MQAVSHTSEKLNNYVYRRVVPQLYKVKKNLVDPGAFHILPIMRGLSVFRADLASPYQVLQECINDQIERSADPDEIKSEKARIWLAKNPNVETLLNKDFRIVVLPINAIHELGFSSFDGPEPNGHINILGTHEMFIAQAEAFVELIDTGRARILTVEECLQRTDANLEIVREDLI